MTKLSPRFSEPIDMARPQGARLLEAFSPKLGRLIRHFDRAAFEYWVVLEADPGVEVFCERPVRFRAAQGEAVADFWVRSQHHEAILLLGEHDQSALPAEIAGVALQVVAEAEVAAARMWILNWQRMLPVIVAARGSAVPGLSRAVLRFVTGPMPLSRIEREFAFGDPTPARATVFELLRTGKLQAPSLRTEALSVLTLLEPMR